MISEGEIWFSTFWWRTCIYNCIKYMQKKIHRQVSGPMYNTTNKQRIPTLGASISWFAFSTPTSIECHSTFFVFCNRCLFQFIKLLLHSLVWLVMIEPSILTSLPVPAAEIHLHSMMLPPACFTVEMVPAVLQTWHLAFRPKSSILVSSEQRILFLMVWESVRCLLANSKRAVMFLLMRSGSHLATLPKCPDWWIAAEMVVLLEGSPISTEELC